MRMQPGAVTIEHDHPGMEEFLVLEGDLMDSDGTTSSEPPHGRLAGCASRREGAAL